MANQYSKTDDSSTAPKRFMDFANLRFWGKQSMALGEHAASSNDGEAPTFLVGAALVSALYYLPKNIADAVSSMFKKQRQELKALRKQAAAATAAAERTAEAVEGLLALAERQHLANYSAPAPKRSRRAPKAAPAADRVHDAS